MYFALIQEAIILYFDLLTHFSNYFEKIYRFSEGHFEE